MRLAINLGMFPPSNYPAAPEFTTRDMVETARLAEERGFEIACMPEAPIYREAIVPLAGMAGATRSILLSSSVLPIYYRSPIITARTFAALDEVSGGRAILGLGVGVRRLLEKQGFDTAQPIQRLEEYVRVVKGLFASESIDFEGKFYQLRGTGLGFTPSRRDIPVFLGAINQRSLRLVGRMTDGVYLPALCVGDRIAESLGYIGEGARDAGRDIAGITIAKFNITSVDPDGGKARSFTRPLLAFYMASPHYDSTLKAHGLMESGLKIREAIDRGDDKEAIRLVPNEAIDAFTVSGTPDQCRKRLEALEKNGIGINVLLPVGETPWGAVKGALSIAES